MRKYWLSVLCLLLAAALGLTACSKAAIKTYSEAETDIKVEVNAEFSLTLAANPTTGYSWEADYDKDLLELVKDDYQADQTTEGLVGSGGTQFYQFKALKAGQTQILLTYLRPWETSSDDNKKVTYTVTIK
jgi:inhibitor of cysteine peptidase